MKRRIIYITILVVLSATGLYMYTEFNRKNKDLLKASAALTIDAASLISAYEQNEKNFNQNFTDKIITVRGTIKNIDKDENPVVISIGEQSGFSSVQCSMDSTHAQLYNSIKEGQLVSLKGMVTGGRSEEMFGTDIILNRCVIEENNGQLQLQ